MSESIPQVPDEQRAVKPCRRRFSDAFKRDAVRLITHERYGFRAAAVVGGHGRGSETGEPRSGMKRNDPRSCTPTGRRLHPSPSLGTVPRNRPPEPSHRKTPAPSVPGSTPASPVAPGTAGGRPLTADA